MVNLVNMVLLVSLENPVIREIYGETGEYGATSQFGESGDSGEICKSC